MTTVIEGRGCDLSSTLTSIVASEDVGGVHYKQTKLLYLGVSSSELTKLDAAGIPWTQYESNYYILGESAVRAAEVLGGVPIRVEPFDPSVNATALLLLLMNLLGTPSTADELCLVACPSGRSALTVVRVIGSLGFRVDVCTPIQALFLGEEIQNGIGVTIGSTFTEVAVIEDQSLNVDFSMTMAGDWIIHEAAVRAATSPTNIKALIEKGFNLFLPANVEEQAVATFYETVIGEAFRRIIDQSSGMALAPWESLPIIFAGEATLLEGFIDVARKVFSEYKDSFLFSYVTDIRLAKSPLTSVSYGLLRRAQSQSA